MPPDYLARLLATTDPAILATWDRHRHAWAAGTDRTLVLAGAEADLGGVPPGAINAWHEAVDRLTGAEEERRAPYLLVAVPTAERALQLGMSLAALEDAVVPGLLAGPDELRREVERVLAVAQDGRMLTIRSGNGHALHLDLGDRPWLRDIGQMPTVDQLPSGAQAVLNLPAGAVYTTVVEGATHGSLWLPRAGEASEVVLRFDGGRIVAIDAASGADGLAAMLDRHTGEPRRISHVGIGLNPRLRRQTGWVLVDEHRHGAVLIALGENRYLGGQNASSLNVDYVVPDATAIVDGRLIVAAGRLAV